MHKTRYGAIPIAMMVLACSADVTRDGARDAALRGNPATLPPSPATAAVPSATPGAGAPFKPYDPPGETCGKADLMLSRLVPQVMLLLDGSTSMRTQYPSGAAMTTTVATRPTGGAGGAPPLPGAAGAGAAGGAGGAGGAPAPVATRWSAIRDALLQPMTGVVARLQGSIKFGLAVFGTNPTCPLPLGVVDPALNNYEKIATVLPIPAPGNTTPTGLALSMIVDRLADPTRNVDPDDASSPRIIVLATDGDPNDCDTTAGAGPNYAPSIAAALKAQSKGQRMYVISVGEDAAKDHLQQLANIGAGKAAMATPPAPVFYPTDPAALADTLQNLIGNMALCEVALQGQGVKAGLECTGQVALNNTVLRCNDPNGFKLTDSLHILLQGTACDSFKAGNNATTLRVRFPCPSVVPQ